MLQYTRLWLMVADNIMCSALIGAGASEFFNLNMDVYVITAPVITDVYACVCVCVCVCMDEITDACIVYIYPLLTKRVNQLA